jgi:hypothetical protein
MIDVCEKIMSMYYKPEVKPATCIYEERIKCFEKLTQLQKNLQTADKENASLAQVEGVKNEALKSVAKFNEEYRKEYELCEKIMKY